MGTRAGARPFRSRAAGAVRGCRAERLGWARRFALGLAGSARKPAARVAAGCAHGAAQVLGTALYVNAVKRKVEPKATLIIATC